MKALDIAIAGAGPAGLAAGLLLARRGHRVVLHEQFERPAPIGSGLMLQATGLAVLDHLGLGGRIRGLGRRIERLFGKTVAGRTVLDVRYAAAGGGLHGLAVHRAALFTVLHDAVTAAGIPLQTGWRVADLDHGGDGRVRLVDAAGRRSAAFDLAVDCTGGRSALGAHAGVPVARKPLAYGALWATVPWPADGPFAIDALEQRYRRASVMIGVLPVGRQHEGGPDLATFFWSLKPADHQRWRADGLAAWREAATAMWPETAPLTAAIDDPDRLVLAAYGHHTLPLPFGRAVAFVGDSAHSTSPQLGQGANMALLDAAALAESLDGAGDLADGLARYARARRWHVRGYQAMSAAFTPLYQSDSRLLPAVRDAAVPVISALPLAPAFLARLVAGLMFDPLPALGLARPGT